MSNVSYRPKCFFLVVLLVCPLPMKCPSPPCSIFTPSLPLSHFSSFVASLTLQLVLQVVAVPALTRFIIERRRNRDQRPQ